MCSKITITGYIFVKLGLGYIVHESGPKLVENWPQEVCSKSGFLFKVKLRYFFQLFACKFTIVGRFGLFLPVSGTHEVHLNPCTSYRPYSTVTTRNDFGTSCIGQFYPQFHQFSRNFPIFGILDTKPCLLGPFLWLEIVNTFNLIKAKYCTM